ncbi:Zn(II)2Cys6 transcription factor [Aspergillus aculeatinus CBS 121060]|uniref:Uncharacterized protein n=1 Tax=Aspergillus aculeatinus CBS 121060 TaxID=1448322 RepID=A0ACD1GXE7_9EURO|nr:hypothetical protein BO66DRAFT_191708 [Aspergillus aculeatinus CBS 121060]RAH65958.1 hypothetical protein BO66DRAFT_191708 [Aspergillus aculeatinus CBS 121060]
MSLSGHSSPKEDVPEHLAAVDPDDVDDLADRSAGPRAYRRSRSGCFTCRLRRKKCDETRPTCKSCAKLSLKCDYKTPQWWATPELRQKQMDRIKTRIRQTKVMQKEGSLEEYMNRIRALVQKAPTMSEHESNRPMLADGYNPYAASLPTPVTPFDVNVTMESQAFVLPSQVDFGYSAQLPTPVQGSIPCPAMAPSAPDTYIPVCSTANTSLTGLAMPSASMPVSSSASTLLTMNPPAPSFTSQVQLVTPELTNNEWYSMNSNSNMAAPTATITSPSTYSTSGINDLGINNSSTCIPCTAGCCSGAGGQSQNYSHTDIGSTYTRSLTGYLHALIPLSETERPLLDNFIDHVVRLVLPIPEIYPGHNVHVREIVNSMMTNRSYLHCCLSVSAIHLKTSMGMEDQMDHDIMQHRYAAISQLSRALNRPNSSVQVMDATLAMIFYPCMISTPENYLPDIPWSQHFQAVTNLVKKLQYPPSPFNVSLITWIDILGATMTGRSPEFSHTYRTKHLRGIASGLQQLMGCDDRVMYLISEISCLESLRIEGTLDDLTISHHVSALNTQIHWTEPSEPTFEGIYTSTGSIRPEQVTKVLSSMFRIAARIYLYTIIPSFDHQEDSVVQMVSSMANTLLLLPAGPMGFDRALVWPLFMAGVYSLPSSSFRKILTERVAALGYLGNFGSFGKMYRVLKEVWKSSLTATSSATSSQQDVLNSPPPTATFQQQSTVQQTKPHRVHWREVMARKKWNFLLM